MQGTLFLLLTEQDLDTAMNAICDLLGVVNRGGGNTVEANNGVTRLSVSVVAKGMKTEPEDYFQRQIGNIAGHFHTVETAHTDSKLNALYQITSSQALGVVMYEYPDGAVDQEQVVMRTMADLLHRLDGLLLVASGTRLLDRDLRLVLSDDGESELDAFLPAERALPAGLFDGASVDQVERRNRSVAWLRERGIYVTEWLPLIESEAESRVRTPREIALRAAALLAVALHAEVLMTEGLDVPKARGYSDSILRAYGCGEALSPDERAFLQNNAPEEGEAIHFSWQYECLYVMLWALGLVGDLCFPDRICDVAGTVRAMREHACLEELLSAAAPRAARELLDEADLLYRMDWGCVDARIKGLPMPRGLDGGVVMERHKCLNWLIGSGGAGWDDVDVST